MYQWVSDEAWLILGIISLIVYVFKGIDYERSVFDERNRMIYWLIGISLFQIILSAMKIYGILLELHVYVSNLFNIYGAMFMLNLFFEKGTKLTNVDKFLLSIFFLCVIGIVIIKFSD